MLMFVLYWALAIGCWAYAIRFGGRTALWGFALFILAMIGTTASTGFVASQNLGTAWTGVNPPLLLTDFLYFVGLYVLALRSRRYWPIWSAGFQLLCVLTHFGPLLDPATRPKLYRGLESVWILPMILTMVIGIEKDRRGSRQI